MSGKTFTVSDYALNRLRNIAAPGVAATYVNCLRVAPTLNSPDQWVEWGVEDTVGLGTAVSRIQVFESDQGDGTPYWSAPQQSAVYPSKREIYNNNGIRFGAVSLPAATTIVAMGVFSSATSTYEYNAGTSKAEVAASDLPDLLYWELVVPNISVNDGETLVFLATKFKVTEQ